MQSVPLWFTLTLAALGVAGGLIAGLGSVALKSRSDLQLWRRNLKVEAYQEYAKVTTVFVHAATKLYGADPNAHDKYLFEAARELIDAIRQTDVAGHLVQMVAPRNVQREVTRTQVGGERLRATANTNPRPASEAWNAALDEYFKAQDKFLAEVQNDLGFTGYVLMPGNRPTPEAPLTARERALVWIISVVVAAALVGVVIVFRR